jgi:translocation and assembly module TamB
MRRALKILAWALGAGIALALLLAAAVLVTGNSQTGREMIARITDRLTDGHVKLIGLGGTFPADLTLAHLQLIDRRGIWLTADQISVRWSPGALLERRIQVDRLYVARLDMERVPVSESSGGKVSIPHIDVAEFRIDVLKLGSELAGTPATLSVQGGGQLHSLEDANADVVARRTDGDGLYTLHLHLDPARMDAALELHEPASGPLENILQLPGLGALAATLNVKGPRNAERIEIALSAGQLRARSEGSVDLPGKSADLEYSLEAPAMSPRADIAWRRLALQGRWRGSFSAPAADGRLDVDGLRLAGGTAIAGLRADLTASRGSIAVKAVVNGLEIPGPQAALLAKDPLQVDASMRLDDAARPLTVSASHRLFALRAQAVTAGQQQVTVDLRLPNVAPFAALAGQDVRGDATIKAELLRRRADVSVTMDANIGVSGGTADWVALVGKRVALQLSANLSDDGITLERLRLAGDAFTFSSNGSATRRRPVANIGPHRAVLDDYIEKLQARWDLNLSDLGVLSPELNGDLQASGHLSGPPTALIGDATLTSALSIRGSPRGAVSAELKASGLPTAPSGTVQAHGMVDGAPLKVDVGLERGARNGVRAVIHQAEWKSAHLAGELDLEQSLANSRGVVRLRLAQLGDLDRVLGVTLKGSLEADATFTPAGGRTHAEFQVDGRDLVAGQFSGSVHLTGKGATDAVDLKLSAEAPNVKGAVVSISSSALLNLDAHSLRVASAVARYRGQELRMLSPVRLSFASGLSIDNLRLGAQDAVLQIDGELAPALDVRASLHQLKPTLFNVFVPDLWSDGTIEGQLHLQGSLDAPTGSVALSAIGMRSSADVAADLPALDLHASAELDGKAASVTARLNAGSGSLLEVSGSAPLNAAGALALKIQGKLDIGLANPMLEARGMHAGGQLAMDATVAGTTAAPQIHGTVTLTEGNWRDYARGLSLSGINAEVLGSEGTLQIKSFKASAASGTVVMTGSIGVLQPKVPLDLKIIATNAQPIASSILTARLNADISVKGTARERIDVAGTIHVIRATIGIPDSLPPEVAVLDVRRRGQHAPPAAGRLVIGVDVAIQAPNQILVQGRGLDAELGGDVRISGTSDSPLISGGFDLQRGSFTIAGNKLTFDTTSNVSFDGAGLKRTIDPTLNFTAKTTVTGVTVTLTITGHADSPQFEFSSDSGLPQDEIMARLLFGEPTTQLSALQVAEIGSALATLTGVGGSGSNPLTKLQKALGLDRLYVGSNTTTTPTGAPENSGAAIGAGRYVTKRVYVEAKQTTTGASQVLVDVDLTKRLKLQTRLGNGTAVTQGTTPENDPGSSIGLSYQFEY